MKLMGFYAKGKKTRRRRKRRNWRPLIVLVIFGALVFGAVSVGYEIHDWLTRPTEPVELEYIGDIPVYEQYIPEDSPARPGVKRRVEYIVLHETDNFSPGADAAAHANFLSGLTENDEPRSWHYTVDDHQIYHHLPDDEAGYHASDRLEEHGGNLNGIGIEMCVNEGGDYEQTLENAVQLTAKLMIEYRLDIGDVKKHQDFSGKICPARLIENDRWEEFLKRVETAAEEQREAEKEAEQEAERREHEKEDSILPAFLYDLLHGDDAES